MVESVPFPKQKKVKKELKPGIDRCAYVYEKEIPGKHWTKDELEAKSEGV